MCTWELNNRKHRASTSKEVHSLLQSEFLQAEDANSARNEFTNYKITAKSLEAYERNKVLGMKNAELEGRLAIAAGIIREVEKNQAALKSQLAIKVSTDLFCP